MPLYIHAGYIIPVNLVKFPSKNIGYSFPPFPPPGKRRIHRGGGNFSAEYRHVGKAQLLSVSKGWTPMDSVKQVFFL